ncbi:NERD domain-containing protein [Candidatus Saccharibacteria bacterium]|nr:NERD domain-containing protein [Candidatus Saccharibacteria bacterium]MBR0415675.1 NERD domain-containing protein [Candidatus Saccharibacteria bacterium]
MVKLRRWIQYIGREKNHFYSPLLQNKNHAKYLKNFLARDKIEVPIIPLESIGEWLLCGIIFL